MALKYERDIEKEYCKRIREIGGYAYKFLSTVAGVPDRVIIHPLRGTYFVEFKRPNGKLSPIQEVQIKRMRKMGATVYVVSSTDEIDV